MSIKTKEMKRFGNYWVSDDAPKEGDRVICTQKNNVNFGTVETVTKIQADLRIVDTANWKVIVDSKEEVTLDGLREFAKEHEVVYASSYGKVNKKLTITLAGGYKVYHNEEVVFETMTPAYAVKTYNTI